MKISFDTNDSTTSQTKATFKAARSSTYATGAPDAGKGSREAGPGCCVLHPNAGEDTPAEKEIWKVRR